MNNPESIKIIDRFYQALNMLIDQKTLKSKRAFTMSHEIEYTSFTRCETEQTSNRFQLSWITNLTTDYPISIDWIMKNKGGMITAS